MHALEGIQRNRRPAFVAAYAQFMLAFATIIFFATAPEDAPDAFAWAVLSIACVSTAIHFLGVLPRGGKFSWLSFSPLFVTSFSIIAFQIPVLELLGYSVAPAFDQFVWADRSILLKSVTVSTLGLVLFFFAFSLFQRTAPPESGLSEAGGAHIDRRRLRVSGRVVLLISALAFAAFLMLSGSYVYGEYTPDDASVFSSYAYKIFKVGLTASILLKHAELGTRSTSDGGFHRIFRDMGIGLSALVGAFIGLSLFVGDRGPVIYFVLLFASPWIVERYRLRLVPGIVMLALASIAMSVVGEVRQSRFDGSSYAARLEDSLSRRARSDDDTKRFESQVPLESTAELAFSVRALNHVLVSVPSQFDYAYGWYQLRNIVDVVPGLASRVSKMVHGSDPIFDGSSSFVTFLIQGRNPTYGDGTSVTADLYLDFGVFGVGVGMFLFGAFVARNEWRSYRRGGFLGFGAVFFWVYFANCVYLPRTALLLELSNVVLTYFLIHGALSFVRRTSSV